MSTDPMDPMNPTGPTEYTVDDIDIDSDSDSVQSGGRFVGKGVYGCVFDPPPRCVDGSVLALDSGLHAVGKLASDNITTELKWGKMIMDLPEASSYFALPSKSCKPALPIKDPDSDRCPFIRTPAPGQSLSLLILPLAGTRIDHWAKKDRVRMAVNFERILIHLLEGISIYQAAGIIHNDIHPGNVLVTDDGVSRFIDFGLAFRVADVRKWFDAGWQGTSFNPKIIMVPPEVYVWKMILNGISVRNGCEQINNVFWEDYPRLERFKQENLVTEMETFVRESDDFRTGDGGVFARRYAKKWDMWRIGLVMWFEWYDLISIPGLQRRPEVAATLWARRDVLRATLKGLTRFDPRKRWSAARALFELAPNNVWALRTPTPVLK